MGIILRYWYETLEYFSGDRTRYLYEALKEYFSRDRIALFVQNPKRLIEILLLNYNLQMCCFVSIYFLSIFLSLISFLIERSAGPSGRAV